MINYFLQFMKFLKSYKTDTLNLFSLVFLSSTFNNLSGSTQGRLTGVLRFIVWKEILIFMIRINVRMKRWHLVQLLYSEYIPLCIYVCFRHKSFILSLCIKLILDLLSVQQSWLNAIDSYKFNYRFVENWLAFHQKLTFSSN